MPRRPECLRRSNASPDPRRRLSRIRQRATSGELISANDSFARSLPLTPLSPRFPPSVSNLAGRYRPLAFAGVATSKLEKHRELNNGIYVSDGLPVHYPSRQSRRSPWHFDISSIADKARASEKGTGTHANLLLPRGLLEPGAAEQKQKQEKDKREIERERGGMARVAVAIKAADVERGRVIF